MTSLGCFCGQKKNPFWDIDEFTGSLLSLLVTTLKTIWSAADLKRGHLESVMWRDLWLICWGVSSATSGWSCLTRPVLLQSKEKGKGEVSWDEAG